MPAQQGWPAPPQLPQLPFMHAMLMVGHIEPAPVQMFATQQPPELQVVFAQHGSPGPPQAVQTRGPPPPIPPLQMSFASQARPAQQVWPGPPQVWQTPPTQAEPAELQGVLPVQHTVPTVPHPLPGPPSPPEPLPLL
jgi:hypothetical protein